MSNELIVYTPKDPNFDYDYVAFSFNGKNSYDDFGIYRVSEGSKYNLSLIPELSDKTAEAIGSDGDYYFQTWHKKKVFNINFAFDKMTEAKLREFKRWLNGKDLAPLWFAENPYKVYYAKVTGSPTFSALPFEDATLKRVYKGTGTIQFTCYYPYARTPDKVQRWGLDTNTWVDVEKSVPDGRHIDQYYYFNNRDEWRESSGLTNTVSVGKNYGDLPAPFVLTTNMVLAKNSTISVGDQSITLLEDCPSNSEFSWNSQTGAITAVFSGKRRAVNFSGNSLLTIPVTTGSETTEFKHNTSTINNSASWAIKYHYWYY